MSSGSTVLLEDCWAKTNENGRPALPVLDHCLNVGAVARLLKSLLPHLLVKILPEDGVVLVAAHDIGKITPGFLLKCSDWAERWAGLLDLDTSFNFEGRHAVVSQSFLCTQFRRPPKWLVSVGGHHGKYFSNSPRLPVSLNEGSNPVFDSLKKELLDELVKVFGPLVESKIKSSARVHYFTGFMIFSDWIGSNENWFPLECGNEAGPVNLLDEASRKAGRAVEEIGWAKRGVRMGRTFGEQFAIEGADSFVPRPLQRALIDAVDTQGLYILEAPMGGGKTEAALAAAYRRWTEGEERGLYFALPTQLTSNRIHDRVTSFLNNVMEDPSTLAKVHGTAWLSEDKLTTVGTDEADANGAEANRWFSDTRKSMLAPFGTGTIDQALMATMPVKFSALRLFALGGKVVVIDEVHSYDPYTSALVDRSVESLLEVGCTVIVLSATLTKRRRASLVEAAGARELECSDAYPLLTKVAVGDEVAQPVPIKNVEVEGKVVEIEFSSAEDGDWIEAAADAAERGACVLVVRNTVALAQESLRLVASECRSTGVEFGLLHSRYPQFQRNNNEDVWMRRLGKGDSERPSGCVLVGTQVVEQSVDIDADLLITDLAPSDLLLQRIGRLHRHPRSRPDGFDRARCIVISPTVDWSLGEKEVSEAIGPSAYVYSPFVLFQAQRVWKEETTISLPGDIREILEKSEKVPNELPKGASEAKQSYEQLTKEQINTATMRNVMKTAVSDIEGVSTRWGTKATAYVVLLKKKPVVRGRSTEIIFGNGKKMEVDDLGFNFELARRLHLNAVRVPRYLVADTLESNDSPTWLQSHMQNAVLAVCETDANDCEVLYDSEFSAYSLSYSEKMGLSYDKNEGVTANYGDEVDGWY